MGKKWIECSNCDGVGYFTEYHDGVPSNTSTCPSCHGDGGHVGSNCGYCGGSGKVAEYHGGEFDGWVNCTHCG